MVSPFIHQDPPQPPYNRTAAATAPLGGRWPLRRPPPPVASVKVVEVRFDVAVFVGRKLVVLDGSDVVRDRALHLAAHVTE